MAGAIHGENSNVARSEELEGPDDLGVPVDTGFGARTLNESSSPLREATGRAMAYWFGRDIGEKVACLDRGGTPACPCENPANTMW